MENNRKFIDSGFVKKRVMNSLLEYCKVNVRGEFQHDKIVYIGPRSLFKDGNPASAGGLFGSSDGIGFHVITPFKLENSDQKILVNRGWVPRNKISASSRGEIFMPPGNIGQAQDMFSRIFRVRINDFFLPKMLSPDSTVFAPPGNRTIEKTVLFGD